MPDEVLSGDGSGLSSPDPGPSIFPMGGPRVTGSRTESQFLDLGRLHDVARFWVAGMDTFTADVYCITAAYPSSTMKIERSIDGITWTDTTATVTAEGQVQITGSTTFITGSNWVRFRVTTAAASTEKLARITVTSLRTTT